MQSQVSLDLLPTIPRVRDQFGHIQVNEKVVCVQNHFPTAQLSGFLQPIDEGKQNELLARDRA
jgi:hypothetical protein